MNVAKRIGAALPLALLLAGICAGQDRAPRAGEAHEGTAFGRLFTVEARDRARVTEIGLGLQWIPDGPSERVVVPAGGLFFWRNADGGRSRLRAVVSGLFDDVRYARTLAPGSPWEIVASFENVTLPFARSEYAEGERIASEELKWGYLRAGAGFGYRRGISPGHQDNAVEATLAYEPGYV